MAYLKVDKALTKISNEYTDFAYIFSPKLVIELYEPMEINNYTIKLINNWLPPYSPIYSLGPLELETMKTYIKKNLVNGFIRPSKSPTEALIFFDKKANESLRLYVDYQGLNNLTIKNCYPLLLVGELLDWLGWTRYFTQLHLTNAYHGIKIQKDNE